MFEFLLDPIFQTWIVQGFLLTVEITLFGVLLGLGLGTLLAIGDIYGNKPVKAAIAVYVEFFRGSPLFVQLFLAVYTVPAILNVQIDHLVLAFLVFGLNSAGYQKGYMKGSIETIFGDQMQAGLSVGMTKIQTLRHVILPQAYIGFMDLVGAGRSILINNMQIIPVWLVVGAIYFVWITAFSKMMDIIYDKKKIPGIELLMQ
jgi:His/Glu/Gln/Arg/opine family amino acid ABC transporter permease subunit